MKSNKIETLLNEVHSKILVPKQTRLSTPANGIAPQVPTIYNFLNKYLFPQKFRKLWYCFLFLNQIIHTTSVHGEAIHKRAGDTLRLECQVDGIPPPSIVWYKVSQGAYICTLKSQASYYSHNELKDFKKTVLTKALSKI